MKIRNILLPRFLSCHNHHHNEQNYQFPPHFIPYFPLPLPPPITYNQSPSTKNSQSSQIFPSMPQNTSSIFHKPPNSSSRAQTPSIEEVDTQISQFSTQIGLEEEDRVLQKIKRAHDYSFQLKRKNFSLVHGLMSFLIQSLVMVKNYKIFWKKVIENYNIFHGNLSERSYNQLRSR